MSVHAETALDQLRLAQAQLRHLDDTASTPAHQLLVFLAAAVVHAVLEVAEAYVPPTPTWQELLPVVRSGLPRIDAYDESVARNVAIGVEMDLERRARRPAPPP